MLPSREVEQLHWGGGTPTYLTPAQIEDFYGHIRNRFSFSDTASSRALPTGEIRNPSGGAGKG